MPKREKRYHLYLDPDVVDWYKATFQGDLGFSRAVREVMKSYMRYIETRGAAQAPSLKGISDDDAERIAASAGASPASAGLPRARGD